ncbi:MAG: hypothetical protein WB762_35190 [Candidatus Sulfotelmatobacter sp.]
MHNILFDFYAKNQVPKAVEHLHFNAMYRASNGENVGIIGYPIFIGLNVSSEGVDFKCEAVNVKNDSDEKFLKMLDSDTFKAGLKLATSAYSDDVDGRFQRDVNGHSGHVNKVGAQRRWDYNHARHLRD